MDHTTPMTYDDIVDAIEEKIRKISPDKTAEERYKMWYIGITHDVEERKEDHKDDNLVAWESWTAIDKETALKVEKHFINLGMRPKVQRHNNNYDQKIVYVF